MGSRITGVATCLACGLWLGDDGEARFCDDCLGSIHGKFDPVRKRYFRKTSESPDGVVLHHGDCWFWIVRICTCGLLHDLSALADDATGVSKFYPAYWTEVTAHGDALERARAG